MRQLPTNLKTKVKKILDTYLKTIAVKGDEYIKTELAKRGSDANVSHSIGTNEITFTVKPKIEKLNTEKIPEKETAKFKKVLGPVPIEMLNQEMGQQEFPVSAIDRAMTRTQDAIKNKFDELIQKIY